MSIAAGVSIVAALSVATRATPSLGAMGRLLHTHLVKSEPAANDTFASAPRVVRLWFSEKVELAVTSVKLSNAAGATLVLGPLVRPDTGEFAPIVTNVAKPLAAGTYTVTWSTAAKDGHPAKGTYPFVVRVVH